MWNRVLTDSITIGLFFGTVPQIARFHRANMGPRGSCRPQMGPMLAPWTLVSGVGSPVWNAFSFVDAAMAPTNWQNALLMYYDV